MSRIAATSDLKEARMTVSTSASSGTRVRAWAKRSLALDGDGALPGVEGAEEFMTRGRLSRGRDADYLPPPEGGEVSGAFASPV